MPPPPQLEHAQSRILCTFTVLHHIRQDWGGALILNVGLDPQGAALSLAANVAGAVCLALEQDPILLREAMRSAACDFIVNTLDEALRAMKNEVRRHKPLSVGLEGDPVPLLQELLDRGLAPELFTSAAAHGEAARHFQQRGALLLDLNDPFPLEAAIPPTPWHLQTFTFKTPAELRAFDTRALALIDDSLRRTWLLAAHRILPRDRTRTLWLTPAERELLEKSGLPGVVR